MASIDFLSEDEIRLRSYLIWQREGCPHGDALAHWFQARAELEAELQAGPPPRRPLAFVMPRIPISARPYRRTAIRISRSAA